jgi:RecA-family ATPase
LLATAAAPAAPAKTTRGGELDRFDRAADFLASIAGGGLIALAAIAPDVVVGGLTGRTFHTTKGRAELCAWLQDQNGRANIYYSLNEPKPENERKGKAGKLKEDDVARIRGIAVDLDPHEGNYASERERLLGIARMWSNHVVLPASIAIDSGGGVQIIWLFPEPLPNDAETRAKVKAQAKGLGRSTGSDPVQSVDHLFRVPFTLNLPNEKKRLNGRTQTEAKLLHFDPAAACTLETLAIVAPPVVAESPATIVDLDDFSYQDVIASAEGEPLPAHLAPVADAIRSSKSFATAMTNGDKSGRDYAVLRCVIEHGRLSDPTEIGIVAFSLSPQRLLEDEGKGRGGYYASQTIKKALAKGGRPQDWLTGAPAALDAPRAALSEQPATSAPKRLDLHVITGVVDPKSISVRKWVVEPQVPVGDVALCIGEPGISKSTLALRTALAVATGREDILRGRDASGNPITIERLHRSGAVLVYNAEDRLDEMKRRLRAAQVHHGVTVADMRHPIILYSGVDMPTFKIMNRPDARSPLKRAEGADQLEEAIRRYDIKLVIADPLVALADGALENDNNDMDTVLQTFANMAAKLEIGMMLLHHTNKGGRDKAGDMGAARGASAIAGKVRVAFTLTRVSGDGENEAEWGLKAEEHLVRLDYAKRTLSKPGNETVVFKRASVPVGNGTGRLPQGVDNLFSASPLARLEAEGDMAPVLEVVDVKARVAATKAGADSRQQAEAKQIAVIVDVLMGDDDKAKLADLHDELSAKMNAARICKGTTRNAIKDRVLAALLDGCEIERNGQVLRMCVEREGKNDKAPWYVVRNKRNTSDIHLGAGR